MFDTEKFIVEIEQRSPLYDVGCKDYCNRNIKARCWFEVCEAMEEDWANLSVESKDKKAKDFMKKWKAIRDYFVKEYRNQKKCQTGVPATKKKKYLYYDQLSFLIPHVKGNTNTQSNITALDVEDPASATDVDDPGDVEQTNFADDYIPPEPTEQSADDAIERRRKPSKAKSYRLGIAKTVASTSKSLTDILTESVNMKKLEMTSDKYGNKAFLNSFVPMMDSFPPNVAAYTRMKISELFNRISCEGIPFTTSNVPDASVSSYYSSISSRSQTPHEDISSQETEEFSLSNYLTLN